MPSSKVVRKEESDGVVLSYEAKKFPVQISKTAKKFVSLNASEPNDFIINPAVAESTGVGVLQRQSLEEQVEQEALARLKDMQEEAYKEAYELGLQEGRDSAFKAREDQLTSQLAIFESTLESLLNLKNEMVAFNEAHIIKMIYLFASKIAMGEIEERPELILPLVKQCVETTQQTEEVTLLLHKEDLEFINSVKDELGRDFEILKKIEMRESTNVDKGGCIVQTNYGSVDGSLEKRVEKLWSGLQERSPKSKDTVGE